MPTYRSITTSCVSQFDILTIPEFKPPITPTDPFQNVPPLISADNSLVSVYLPTYPSSQFWLCYSIAPPYPPKAIYYFKLYTNGKMIVSWGCGEEEGYKGKTMFGLFTPDPSPFQDSLVERRVLFFGPDREHGDSLALDSQDDVMEIRVFRSKGRKRIEPEVQDFHSLSGNAHSKSQQHATESGLNLVNAGLLPVNHPRRFYKYALLDPLDQPFATFRYYCRSWDQLEALGVISPLASIDSSSIGSRGPIERPSSPKGSNHTIDSNMTVADSINILTNPSTDTIMHHANRDISHSIAAAQNDTMTSTIEDRSSADTEEQDLSSPLRARIIRPFTLPRPGTPPPSFSTTKLTQLPPTIPPTDTALNTLASKESFASLVRTHLPSPDSSAFQLHELVAEPRPAMPLRTRSTSIGILNNVLSSAKNRRKRSGESSGSEDIQSSASDACGQANAGSASPKGSKLSDNDSSGSLKGSKASDEDYVASPKMEDDGQHKHKAVEKEGSRRRVREEEKRDSTSGASGTSGSQEGEKKGEKKGKRKQVNLWEQL